MTNTEVYNVISESLQNDIDDGKITCEHANILNDIAYDIYVENASVDDGVAAILDRYITESAENDNEEEAIDDAADAIKAEYERTFTEAVSVFDKYIEYVTIHADAVNSICEAYDNNEISEAEMEILIEAVNTKYQAYLEANENKISKSVLMSKLKAWGSDKLSAAKATVDEKIGSKKPATEAKRKATAALLAVTAALSSAGCPASSIAKVKAADRAIDTVVTSEISNAKENESVNAVASRVNKSATEKYQAILDDLINQHDKLWNKLYYVDDEGRAQHNDNEPAHKMELATYHQRRAAEDKGAPKQLIKKLEDRRKYFEKIHDNQHAELRKISQKIDGYEALIKSEKDYAAMQNMSKAEKLAMVKTKMETSKKVEGLTKEYAALVKRYEDLTNKYEAMEELYNKLYDGRNDEVSETNDKANQLHYDRCTRKMDELDKAATALSEELEKIEKRGADIESNLEKLKRGFYPNKD